MRDMSAFTTLDNANMGNDFDKWANRNGLVATVAREVAGTGWNARQPEIDALKAENELTLAANKGLGRLVDALQAEAERLKADAERYRWLREQHWNEADFSVVRFPKESVKLGTDCPSLLRLDEAIDAAMKDFSTRQKEEG